MLEGIGNGEIGLETPDCSVIEAGGEKRLVSDPYIQGRIACCNVLSDLYAMGVLNIGTILMVLGVTKEMEENEREICTRMMVKGFDDCAKEAGTSITGGQTIYSSAPIIGGTAIAVEELSKFLIPIHAEAGDVLVLTKPIGTQLITAATKWAEEDSIRWHELKDFISKEELVSIYLRACDNMATLNREAASLMMEKSPHACTDVTGFGLLGHVEYLAKAQKRQVQFVIDKIPIYKGIKRLDGIRQHIKGFKIDKGRSAETSGGLLIAMSQKDAVDYVTQFKSRFGRESWIIGRVIENKENPKSAILSPDVEIVEV